MIMRVTWGKIRPGKWDEYETLWKAYAANSASTKGLKGRWLLRDKENADAGYSISIWDSSEDFDAYSKQVVLGKDMQECFVGQYVATVCDIRAAEIDMLIAGK